MRVLVIDDDQDFLTELTQRLITSGHTVTAGDNVEDAIKQLTKYHLRIGFDVILLDLRLR